MPLATAFVFPGLSLHPPRVADDLPGSDCLYNYVSTRLGWDLRDAINRGRRGACVAQAAVFCRSTLALHALQSTGILPVSVAGHSLGQTAALLAARSIGLRDAIGLVIARSRILHEFEDRHLGSMSIVLTGTDPSREATARRYLNRLGLGVAARNAPGNLTVAGPHSALEQLTREASSFGITRTVRLDITAPYHSRLMEPATLPISRILLHISLRRPTIPLLGDPPLGVVHRVAEARALLTHQITWPVDWVRTIMRLQDSGVDTVVEVGSSRLLTSLIHRIAPTLRTLGVEDESTLTATARALTRRSGHAREPDETGLDVLLPVREPRHPLAGCSATACPEGRLL
jgi:[acyl-carrier-protein] S-malonyltransferase